MPRSARTGRRARDSRRCTGSTAEHVRVRSASGVDQYRSREQVADAIVAVVEPLGVEPVQPAHSRAEVRVRRHQRQVVVGVHQAVRVEAPAVAVDDVAEQDQEPVAILVGDEHGRLVVPANAHVVVGAGGLHSESSGHADVRRTPAARDDSAPQMSRICADCAGGAAVRGLTPVRGRGRGIFRRGEGLPCPGWHLTDDRIAPRLPGRRRRLRGGLHAGVAADAGRLARRLAGGPARPPERRPPPASRADAAARRDRHLRRDRDPLGRARKPARVLGRDARGRAHVRARRRRRHLVAAPAHEAPRPDRDRRAHRAPGDRDRPRHPAGRRRVRHRLAALPGDDHLDRRDRQHRRTSSTGWTAWPRASAASPRSRSRSSRRRSAASTRPPSRPSWPGPRSASCATTSTPPRSSWATRAR